MRKLTIKKAEGKFYICEDKEGKLFAIEMAEMPQEARIGDAIEIDNDGVITANLIVK